MAKFEEIDASKIEDGLLLNEEQVTYVFKCIKDALQLMDFIKRSLNDRESSEQADLFLKSLEDDLKHCVIILRKENDL